MTVSAPSLLADGCSARVSAPSAPTAWSASARACTRTPGSALTAPGGREGPGGAAPATAAGSVGSTAAAAVDSWVHIPIEGVAESLNVAMAGAILCFEGLRQQTMGPTGANAGSLSDP